MQNLHSQMILMLRVWLVQPKRFQSSKLAHNQRKCSSYFIGKQRIKVIKGSPFQQGKFSQGGNHIPYGQGGWDWNGGLTGESMEPQSASNMMTYCKIVSVRTMASLNDQIVLTKQRRIKMFAFIMSQTIYTCIYSVQIR